MDTTSDLPARVDRLERAARRWQMLGVLAIAVSVTVAMLGQAGKPAAPAYRISAYAGHAGSDAAFIIDEQTGQLYHLEFRAGNGQYSYIRIPGPTVLNSKASKP